MNVILIILDDLGWNDVGVHNKKIKTPNLDQLAKNSCELTNNYSFCVCSPTRAMIQTGMYSFTFGCQDLIPPEVDYGLDENLKLIPKYLKNLNYKTYAIGKWHLGHNQKKWHPHKRGYDYHYGNLTGCIDHYSHINCVSPLHDFSENGKKINPEGHSCDLLTNKVLEILEENKNNHFFIYLAYNSPHAPFQSPKDFKNLYKDLPEPRRSYLGMVSHLDYNLGKIFNKLKNLNIFDETLILIQSDNGGWLGKWGGDNFPLKGGKASFYEGGIKPFTLIKHKDIKINFYDGMCHSIDVLPTILDFCGCDLNEKIDGISIKENLLKNKKTNRDLIIGYFNKDYWCFILEEGYKIISEKGTGKLECYEITKDPTEQNPIEINNKIKDKIEILIKACSKRRIEEPNRIPKINKQKLDFWGDCKKDIKILSDNNYYKKKKITKNTTFLKLLGYDIFDKKNGILDPQDTR